MHSCGHSKAGKGVLCFFGESVARLRLNLQHECLDALVVFVECARSGATAHVLSLQNQHGVESEFRVVGGDHQMLYR